MIEEIIKPDVELIFLGCVVGIGLGVIVRVHAFFVDSGSLGNISMGMIIVCLMIPFLPFMIVADYNEQVREQIDTLPCEDLEEAYNLYEKEYIKEKYQKECAEEFKWYV